MADSTRNDEVWLKQRLLPIASDPPPLTALRAIPGVIGATILGRSLQLRYDLRRVSLGDLLPHLSPACDLAHTPGWRMAFWLLTEDIQRQHQRHRLDWDTLVRDIHVSQYQHRRHGRRDERPQHWRKYQAR